MRDEIGSSDALKIIFELSQTKFKKIWMGSSLILFIALLGDYIVKSPFNFAYMFLPFNSNLFFVLMVIKKLITLGFVVFTQAATVLLTGSIEDEKEGHYLKNKIEAEG